MNELEARTLVLNALEEVAPELDPADVDPDTSLRDGADLDSMDLLAFFGTVADAIAVDIPEDDYQQLDSVNLAVDYVVSRSRAT